VLTDTATGPTSKRAEGAHRRLVFRVRPATWIKDFRLRTPDWRIPEGIGSWVRVMVRFRVSWRGASSPMNLSNRDPDLQLGLMLGLGLSLYGISLSGV